MFILERLPPLRKVTLDLSTKSAKILDHLRPWIDLASESGIMPVHGHDMWLENCLKARGLSNNRLDMYSGIRTVVKLMVEVCYSSGGEEEAGAELDQAWFKLDLVAFSIVFSNLFKLVIIIKTILGLVQCS